MAVIERTMTPLSAFSLPYASVPVCAATKRPGGDPAGGNA
jgi:hypothetical protein